MDIWKEKLPPLQKLILLFVCQNNGKTYSVKELSNLFCVNQQILKNQIKKLTDKKVITLNCNKVFYKNNFIILSDFKNEIVRKHKTPAEQAKFVLENFLGRDKLIFDFYKLFCIIFQDEFGKRFSCLPEIPKQAKKSKYWNLFEKFYQIIEQHNLIPEVAIRAQIRRAKQISKYSGIAPSVYVILNSKKALQTYIDYVETQMERKLLLEPYKEELKKAYDYSEKMFSDMKEKFPELNDEELITICHESLSPVWLVRNKIYMKLLNSDKITPTDNVLQMLKNMKNKEFKHLIMNL